MPRNSIVRVAHRDITHIHKEISMATRPRVRSNRSATPPIATAPIASGVPTQEGEDIDAKLEGIDDASESLPDVKLRGEPVPILSREARIERAAYERAERRGFEPGYDLDDWLSAEREIDAESFGENVGRE